MALFDNDDPWFQFVAGRSQSIDHLMLHAIGVIAHHWNHAERGLFHLFCEVTRIPDEECWALVHDLGDLAVSTRIKTIMRINKFHLETISLIDNCLSVYDHCRQNRNSVCHAWTVGAFSNHVFARRSKKPDQMDPIPFSATLADLRRVADDILALETRLWICQLMVSELDPTDPDLKSADFPWPDKQRLPELLWKPHLQAPKEY